MRQDAAHAPGVEALAGIVASVCASSIRDGDRPEESLRGIEGFMGLHPLESRKGRCFKLDTCSMPALFVKILQDSSKAANEAGFAKRLNEMGISCPKALFVEGQVLVRLYIEGKTAAEELDMAIGWGDVGYASSLCSKVGAMLAEAHNLDSRNGHGLVLNDLNLRNFIVSGANSISLIDLADAGDGDQGKDLGSLVVHILTHRPAFTVASEAMADAAYRGYFGTAGWPGARAKAVQGLKEALLEAEARRHSPGLSELARGYLKHLEETVKGM
ncbi:MAG: hypothetical protein KBB09_00045 [Firmicutes bacterium]|nr:hypothetical protein [Bacillota bacterium]